MILSPKELHEMQKELAELDQWLHAWQGKPIHSEEEKRTFQAVFARNFERQAKLRDAIAKNTQVA